MGKIRVFSNEHRNNIRRAIIKWHKQMSEESKKKWSENQRKAIHQPGVIEKMRINCRKASLGAKNAMYGKHHTIETRTKISQGLKNMSDTISQPRSKALAKASLNQWNNKTKTKKNAWIMNMKRRNIGKGNGMYGKTHTQEVKERISKINRERQKELWSNHKYREKQLRFMAKGRAHRPTSFEKIIIEICKRHRLPYKYVGDGKFWLAGKNPDFIRTDGKTICIEVYYSWYKTLNGNTVQGYRKQRQKLFKKYGWKTIFIDETEIHNEKAILAKLRC